MSECTCETSCKRDERKNSAINFGRMDQKDRRNAVKSIMYTLASPKEVTNNVLEDFATRVRKRRKLNTQNTSIVYVVLGELACQSAFCAIVQMSKQTVDRIASAVTEEI